LTGPAVSEAAPALATEQLTGPAVSEAAPALATEQLTEQLTERAAERAAQQAAERAAQQAAQQAAERARVLALALERETSEWVSKCMTASVAVDDLRTTGAALPNGRVASGAPVSLPPVISGGLLALSAPLGRVRLHVPAVLGDPKFLAKLRAGGARKALLRLDLLTRLHQMVAGAREQALVELSPSDLGRLGLLADGTAALSPSDAPINPAYSDDAHTQGQRKGGWRRFIDKQRGRQRLGPHPAASAAAPSAAALETSVVEGLRDLGALAADPESLVSDDLPDDLPEMPPLPVAPPPVPLLRDPPPPAPKLRSSWYGQPGVCCLPLDSVACKLPLARDGPRPLWTRPAPWWDDEADRHLVLGTYRHGYGKYDMMVADDELLFGARLDEFSCHHAAATRLTRSAELNAGAHDLGVVVGLGTGGRVQVAWVAGGWKASRYRGVYAQPGSRRFVAMIGADPRFSKYLGYSGHVIGTYDTEASAARAYDGCARLFLGPDHALCNFEEDGTPSCPPPPPEVYVPPHDLKLGPEGGDASAGGESARLDEVKARAASSGLESMDGKGASEAAPPLFSASTVITSPAVYALSWRRPSPFRGVQAAGCAWEASFDPPRLSNDEAAVASGVFLGTFATELGAALAHDSAARAWAQAEQKAWPKGLVNLLNFPDDSGPRSAGAEVAKLEAAGLLRRTEWVEARTSHAQEEALARAVDGFSTWPPATAALGPARGRYGRGAALAACWWEGPGAPPEDLAMPDARGLNRLLAWLVTDPHARVSQAEAEAVRLHEQAQLDATLELRPVLLAPRTNRTLEPTLDACGASAGGRKRPRVDKPSPVRLSGSLISSTPFSFGAAAAEHGASPAALDSAMDEDGASLQASPTDPLTNARGGLSQGEAEMAALGALAGALALEPCAHEPSGAGDGPTPGQAAALALTALRHLVKGGADAAAWFELPAGPEATGGDSKAPPWVEAAAAALASARDGRWAADARARAAVGSVLVARGAPPSAWEVAQATTLGSDQEDGWHSWADVAAEAGALLERAGGSGGLSAESVAKYYLDCWLPLCTWLAQTDPGLLLNECDEVCDESASLASLAADAGLKLLRRHLPDPAARGLGSRLTSRRLALAFLRRQQVLLAARFALSRKPAETRRLLRSPAARGGPASFVGSFVGSLAATARVLPLWWCPWIHDSALLWAACRGGIPLAALPFGSEAGSGVGVRGDARAADSPLGKAQVSDLVRRVFLKPASAGGGGGAAAGVFASEEAAEAWAWALGCAFPNDEQLERRLEAVCGLVTQSMLPPNHPLVVRACALSGTGQLAGWGAKESSLPAGAASLDDPKDPKRACPAVLAAGDHRRAPVALSVFLAESAQRQAAYLEHRLSH